MKRPPLLIRVQVHGQERRLPLRLPLFLLLPLALLPLIILWPLIFVAIVVLRLTGWEGQLSPFVQGFFGDTVFSAWYYRCLRRALLNTRSAG